MSVFYVCDVGLITICKAIHVQRNDTCPTVIPRICACVKQVLIVSKLIFGYKDFRPIRIQDTGCLLASVPGRPIKTMAGQGPDMLATDAG